MPGPRMQHCFNCGCELGVYERSYGDEPETCHLVECQREARYQMQCEQAEREERAREDDYGRY